MISCGLFSFRLWKSTKQNQKLVQLSDELVCLVEDAHDAINERDSLLAVSYNSVVKMELIAGVDTPNGIIEYKEKLKLANSAIHRMNKADLR